MNPDHERDPLRWIVIASSPYSGSTLLALLMDMHPEITSIGEMDGPEAHDKVRCSCGQWLTDCPHFRAITAHMNANGFDFDLTRWNTNLAVVQNRVLHRLAYGLLKPYALHQARHRLVNALPPYRRLLRHKLNRNRALATALLDITGKRVVFDSSKEYPRLRHLIHDLHGVDLRVVHLVRDVFGFANSSIKYKHVSAERAARAWIKRNRAIQYELAHAPHVHTYFLRYEDLISHPADTMNALARFAAVTPTYDDDAHFHTLYSQYPPEQQHIMGNNRARKRSTPERRPIVLDEKWRTELTPQQIAQINAITGTLRADFGYAPLITDA